MQRSFLQVWKKQKEQKHTLLAVFLCHGVAHVSERLLKALLISPASSAPWSDKGFTFLFLNFPPPNKPDASKAHKAEAQRSEVQIKNALFRQRLPLLSALLSSRSVRGRENQLLPGRPTEKRAIIRTLDGKQNCRKLNRETETSGLV